MKVIDVTDHGVVNDGTTDTFASLKKILKGISQHTIVYFPEGTYFTPAKPENHPDYFLDINCSNIVLSGPGVIKNFMFRFTGAVGEPVAISEDGEIGESTISLESPGSIRTEDTVQLVSGLNCYSEEAGKKQSGSISPSSGIEYDVRFSEVHKVRSVSDKGISLYGPAAFRYPGNSSIVRKMEPVSNVTIEGLTFDMSDSIVFRSITLDKCVNVKIQGCSFVAGDQRGRHLNTRDSASVTVSDCSSRRTPPQGARGNGWNSFLFGAGTSNVHFYRNQVEGDRQSFDITGFDGGGFIYDNLNSSYRTAHSIWVYNNRFSMCHDAITTHPGCYLITIVDNHMVGVSTGIRARGHTQIIRSNIIQSSRAGVVLSCHVGPTLICENIVQHNGVSVYPGTWSAFDWIPLTAECHVLNLNDDIIITNNLVEAQQSSVSHAFRAFRYGQYTSLFSAPKSIGNHSVFFKSNRIRGLPVDIDEELHEVVTVIGNY